METNGFGLALVFSAAKAIGDDTDKISRMLNAKNKNFSLDIGKASLDFCLH